LRKRGFKSAFFSDLRVEREVDIRRRVANVFNKVEEDFETLDDYNDYLYKVECLTDDLVNGKDEAKRKAETELIEWEAQHKAEIDRNKKLARESDEARQKRLAMERDAARQRRMEDLQADAEEKANAARFREEMLDSLQTAEEGQAAQTMNKIILKRRGQQKRDSAMEAMAGATGGLSIRGLRDRKAEAQAEAEEDGPYDPYGGLDMRPQRIDVSPENLVAYGDGNEWVEAARHKDEFKVGGYSPDEYITRALYEAFAGLGVFIGEEKIDREIGTMGAAEAVLTGVTAGSMDVDDPF
jgi:CDK-activating kinase assembly factor MAT1